MRTFLNKSARIRTTVVRSMISKSIDYLETELKSNFAHLTVNRVKFDSKIVHYLEVDYALPTFAGISG